MAFEFRGRVFIGAAGAGLGTWALDTLRKQGSQSMDEMVKNVYAELNPGTEPTPEDIAELRSIVSPTDAIATPNGSLFSEQYDAIRQALVKAGYAKDESTALLNDGNDIERLGDHQDMLTAFEWIGGIGTALLITSFLSGFNTSPRENRYY